MNDIEEHLRNSLNFQAQIIERQTEMIERMKQQMQRLIELQNRYETIFKSMNNMQLVLEQSVYIPYVTIGNLIIGRKMKFQNDTRKTQSGTGSDNQQTTQH